MRKCLLIFGAKSSLKFFLYVQNLAKAIAVVTRAVEEDERQNYTEAYHLYCEGLQYFVPLITAETDPSKRIHLQQRAITYMERAEEIKRSAQQIQLTRQNSNTKPLLPTPQPVQSSSSENAVVTALRPTSNFQHLRK